MIVHGPILTSYKSHIRVGFVVNAPPKNQQQKQENKIKTWQKLYLLLCQKKEAKTSES